jgi:hypothetical protein
MKLVEVFEPGDLVYRVSEGEDSEVARVTYASFAAYRAQDKINEVFQIRADFFGGCDFEDAANFRLWAPRD